MSYPFFVQKNSLLGNRTQISRSRILRPTIGRAGNKNLAGDTGFEPIIRESKSRVIAISLIPSIFKLLMLIYILLIAYNTSKLLHQLDI